MPKSPFGAPSPPAPVQAAHMEVASSATGSLHKFQLRATRLSYQRQTGDRDSGKTDGFCTIGGHAGPIVRRLLR